jgi:hypothetical protein
VWRNWLCKNAKHIHQIQLFCIALGCVCVELLLKFHTLTGGFICCHLICAHAGVGGSYTTPLGNPHEELDDELDKQDICIDHVACQPGKLHISNHVMSHIICVLLIMGACIKYIYCVLKETYLRHVGFLGKAIYWHYHTCTVCNKAIVDQASFSKLKLELCIAFYAILSGAGVSEKNIFFVANELLSTRLWFMQVLCALNQSYFLYALYFVL